MKDGDNQQTWAWRFLERRPASEVVMICKVMPETFLSQEAQSQVIGLRPTVVQLALKKIHKLELCILRK